MALVGRRRELQRARIQSRARCCHPEAPESLAPGRSDRPKPSALSVPWPFHLPHRGLARATQTLPPGGPLWGRGLSWPSDHCGAAGRGSPLFPGALAACLRATLQPHTSLPALSLCRGDTHHGPQGPTALVSPWCSHPSSSGRPGPARCGLLQPQPGRGVRGGQQSLPPHVPLKGLLHPSLRDMLLCFCAGWA